MHKYCVIIGIVLLCLAGIGAFIGGPFLVRDYIGIEKYAKQFIQTKCIVIGYNVTDEKCNACFYGSACINVNFKGYLEYRYSVQNVLYHTQHKRYCDI